MLRLSSLPFSACLLASSALAQGPSRFATQVVQYLPGTGGGTFVPANALGGPLGGGLTNGSTDVTTLGVGGSLTLGFDVTIADGPGTDFMVFENGFVFAGEVFSEVAWVEVSTDGLVFARVPNRYAGPAGGLPSFTAPFGTYAGLPGGMPILANVAGNTIDPFDPAVAGGDGVDLAVLAGDPLVTGGLVDLGQIHFVRLVDIPHGAGLDSAGDVIWDNSGATGSADFDAVSVVQHTGTIDAANQPRVELDIDALGFLKMTITDPQGWGDIDLTTFKASYNLIPLRLARLRYLLPMETILPNGRSWRSAQPVTTIQKRGVLGVSVHDLSGRFSADQVSIQG